MIIKNIKGFKGQHCESVATGTLLKHAGLELSESMLFGIGQGLHFIYWKYRDMNLPFLGGRNKQGMLTENIARHLDLKLDRRETTSMKKAWKNVTEFIDRGIPVGLQLDSYYLDYFTEPVHFAGHFLAMYGYDKKYAYVIDAAVQQGGKNKTLLESLEQARNAKGWMAAKNLSYTITLPDKLPNLKEVLVKAIKANAEDYLNPPIKNLAYKGIEKLSREILKWLQIAANPKEDLGLCAMLMEKAGTGGAIFRNHYRDFLKEALEIVEHENIAKAHQLFCSIAPKWTEVANLIAEAGEQESQPCLEQASEHLKELASLEKQAIGYLNEIEI